MTVLYSPARDFRLTTDNPDRVFVFYRDRLVVKTTDSGAEIPRPQELAFIDHEVIPVENEDMIRVIRR